MMAICLMSICYVYFVNSSIINVAIRDDYEEEISLIQTDITELVERYMALSETIDFDQAVVLGFVEVGNEASFAVRGSEPVTLSLVGNEI